MKIAIVAPSPIPYLIGGAEKLFLGLQRAINDFTTNEAELIKIPCRDRDFWGLIEGYYNFRNLSLDHFDMVITTKYPAWAIKHPNHHLYMQHPCRGVYDLYKENAYLRPLLDSNVLFNLIAILNNTDQDDSSLMRLFEELDKLKDKEEVRQLLSDFQSPLTRNIIRFIDKVTISTKNIKSYSAISKTVANRQGYFPDNVYIEVIHHPTDLLGLYCNNYDYIFTASRIEGLKRVDMLIRAFKNIKADIEFRIAGTGSLEDHCRKIAENDSRIKFLGFITDKEIIHQYANSLFVPFIPYEEDYGLITLEAMMSSKAVLTTDDSGGVKELVNHGINGLIVKSEIQLITEAMQYLIDHKEQTLKMGKKARETVSHINWEQTINKILNHMISSKSINYRKRKKILVVNSFEVSPALSGGQKRIYYLYKEIAKKNDVVLLTLSHFKTQKKQVSQNMSEISIAMTKDYKDAIFNIEEKLKTSATDITAMTSYMFIPEFVEVLNKEIKNSDLVISSHIYLYPAIKNIYRGRLWYDAHNVEYDMKSVVLPISNYREEYLNMIKDVERQCSQGSEYILSVSKPDIERISTLYAIDLTKFIFTPNGMNFKDVNPDINQENKKELKKRLGLKEDTPVAVFVGSWHIPNIEALKVIFKIADEMKECLFLIIGTVCSHPIANYTPKNVILCGVLSEDEKAVLYEISDVALNPICMGGGSNLKIMEYVAYRIPIISTPFGIRGYEIEKTTNLFEVAEIEQFSEALKSILFKQEKDKISEMIDNAYEFSISKYDWSVIAENVCNFI